MVTTEGEVMLIDNIDLNIWDKVGYETEYKKEGWVITPYLIPEKGAIFGSGRELEEKQIVLTRSEAKRLTLGVSEEDGGDYAPDSDFWLDLDGFRSIYKDIPKRVNAELDKVMEYVYNLAEEESQQYRESLVY